MTRTRRHPLPRRSPGHRRTRITVTALLLLTAAACQQADPQPDDKSLTGTVYIGVKTDQPGFSQHREHNDRGFEVDLASYLGEEIGFAPKFHDVVSAEREQELVNKSLDMIIATYSITPKRDDRVDFVGPYFITKQGFLVRADYRGIRNEKDVAGKVVCTVEGSTSAIAQLPGGTTPHTESDYSTCVRKLQQKDVDAVFTDEALLYGYVEQYRNSKVPLEVVRDVSFGSINRYGIGLPEGRPENCARLREALRGYLTEEWASDVKAQLPALVAAYPGDWENRFRPDPEDVDTYSSCKP
ncbi:transporter substrate-binding domain-containing protein [Streptomyces sp. NPDC014986]|uniref:transporter substrate-binding domain-containing protein n=1 Tax=Streptomyces sp. NPDC014986 TaxID=3364934 RepID=UPI0037036936